MASFLSRLLKHYVTARSSTLLQNRRFSMSEALEELHGVPPSLDMEREEFRKRRESLFQRVLVNSAESLRPKPTFHIMVMPAASQVLSTVDVPYRFRQQTDFRYLTGLTIPDSLLVLHNIPSQLEMHHEVLFVPVKTTHEVLWEGPGPSFSDVSSSSGISNVEPLSGLSKYLEYLTSSLAPSDTSVWYTNMHEACPSHRRHKNTENIISSFLMDFKPSSVTSPQCAVHAERLIKSSLEEDKIRRSCSIIAQALTAAIPHSTKLESYEHTFAARLNLETMRRGAECMAFPPVISSGNRANTIHHLEGRNPFETGKMILTDCGVEYDGYVSDMTRCWPVEGSFTSPQRIVYEGLLHVQETLIKYSNERRPISIVDLHHDMLDLLADFLVEVGILDSTLPKHDLVQAAKKYCPHSVGHFLGMDCHDTASVTRSTPLGPGMVFTIEPGLYLPDSDENIPEAFRGIGLRIEDDILVTQAGIEVLTHGCPKSVHELEALLLGS